MTPVATARLRKSALPAIGILARTWQASATSGESPDCSLPMTRRTGAAIGHAPIVARAREMRSDHRAGPALHECREIRPARPRQGDVEYRAHRGAHRLARERVDGLSDEDRRLPRRPRRWCGGSCPDCRGRERFRARPRPRRQSGPIAPSGVSLCSKTPMTVCGLSRRLIFSSTASLVAITSPPRACVVAARRADEPLVGHPAGMDEGADRPAGIDRIGDELQPFGNEQAARLAVLGKRQSADILDGRIGKAGDVPDRPRRRRSLSGIGRPSAEQRGGKGAAAAFFAEHQFARFEMPALDARHSAASSWIERKEARIE